MFLTNTELYPKDQNNREWDTSKPWVSHPKGTIKTQVPHDFDLLIDPKAAR